VRQGVRETPPQRARSGESRSMDKMHALTHHKVFVNRIYAVARTRGGDKVIVGAWDLQACEDS
jgi:hypothetical protein